MSKAVFAIAKYVSDQLRFEPRNIGVIVLSHAGAAARFIGEDQDGNLDLRRVPSDLFNDRQLYADWHRYWRRHAKPCGENELGTGLASVLLESRGAFLMWDGGEISLENDVDQSLADDLYSTLVEPWSAPVSFELVAAAQPPKPLSVRLFREIKTAFAQHSILETEHGGSLFAEHPIRIESGVSGTLPVPHRPRFSQLNGKLSVMEHVDFTEADDDEIREHAVYATWMLEDIQRGQQLRAKAEDVELIAIIKHDADESRESQRYGMAALRSVSSIQFVAWDDARERERFLAKRVEMAGALGAKHRRSDNPSNA